MALAAVAGIPPGDLQPVSVPGVDSVAPLPADCVPALASRIRSTTDPDTRSKLLRLFVLSAAAAAARADIVWREADAPTDYAALARLKKLISNAVKRLAFAKYGERYVETRFRALLPAWSTCSTPAGTRPDRQIAEVLEHKANDMVRPIMETKLAKVFETGAPWAQAWTMAHMATAVATLQELADGHPKLLINEQILTNGDNPVPAIALMTDVDYGRGHNVIAVADGLDLYTSARWEQTLANCLYEWLVAVDDSGSDVAAELRETVLRGNMNTSVATYVLNQAYVP